MSDDKVLRDWLALPRRIYLDTSVLQQLYDFGGAIFEGKSSLSRRDGLPASRAWARRSKP